MYLLKSLEFYNLQKKIYFDSFKIRIISKIVGDPWRIQGIKPSQPLKNHR